mmetsp:Transcript_76730/g.150438  ORF Transcript_76730/g.150438 Transcript_76730/m.150438 type:complete len:166 (+) Transcript_76730:1-498(+)
MTTYFSGAVVRTTHVTGTLTDIGIEVARLVLRGRWGGTWKLEIFVCFFLGFFLGGVLGTAAALLFSDLALFLPAVLYLAMSIGNFAYHHMSRNDSGALEVDTPPLQSIATISPNNKAGDERGISNLAESISSPSGKDGALGSDTCSPSGAKGLRNDLEGGRLCEL